MNVERIEVCFLFFLMEGETVWYLIDIEEDHFWKEMSQYKKVALDDDVVVVMVDTEEGDENCNIRPVTVFLLGASFIYLTH
jgi:hypothetical protein